MLLHEVTLLGEGVTGRRKNIYFLGVLSFSPWGKCYKICVN